MESKKYVLGLFTDGDKAAAAIEALKHRSWELDRIHIPFPHHGIMKALKLKKSPVGLFTLAGGLFGFVAGLGLCIFTATRWGLIVSGKPIVAPIPFFIVGFECTILFSVLGTIVGFLSQARLPNLRNLKTYDPRCSGDRFGVVASCPQGEQENVITFFRQKGGDALPFDPAPRATDDMENGSAP